MKDRLLKRLLPLFAAVFMLFAAIRMPIRMSTKKAARRI